MTLLEKIVAELRLEWGLLLAFARSYSRYRRHSYRGIRRMSRIQVEAAILTIAHSIEKGLTIEANRRSFGEAKAHRLVDLLNKLGNLYGGTKSTAYEIGRDVLLSYAEKNAKSLQEINPQATDLHGASSGMAGQQQITQDAFNAIRHAEFKDFAEFRRSLRDFEQCAVALSDVSNAVSLARQAPSACNRQPAHVYLARERRQIDEILGFHNGSSTFRARIPAVLVVTSSLSAYTGDNEINGAYVDGALFSMTLIYALQYFGLGSCALNWYAHKCNDDGLRGALKLGEMEVVVMLIAIGYAPQSVNVAKSSRKSIDEVLTVLN